MYARRAGLFGRKLRETRAYSFGSAMLFVWVGDDGAMSARNVGKGNFCGGVG